MTEEFLTTRSGGTYARRCMEAMLPPCGVVNKDTIDHGPVWPSHAQAVKYIARHVSSTLPVSVVRDPIDRNRAALKEVFSTFDASNQPEGFQSMMTTLLADETTQLHPELYEAVFATELLARQGPWAFVQWSSEPGNYENQVYTILRLTGYEVTYGGPVVVGDFK